MAQQSSREFPPAVPATRSSDNKVRCVKTLQKFAAAHVSIHNRFDRDRHLNRRDNVKQNRATALVEWCQAESNGEA
jgi:hypothetical protein